MKLIYHGFATLFISSLCLVVQLMAQPSEHHWQGEFGLGTNGVVRTLAAGPNGEIYAGGDFLRAGAIEARHLAVWTGEDWLNIGNFDGRVNRLFVHESILYAGGSFREITTPSGQVIETERVARFNIDSGEWSAMGSGFDDVVLTFEIDGNGNLVAGGCFTQSGSLTMNRIARWNGSIWSAYTTGTPEHTFYGVENNCVRSLFYEHESSRLYVGGDFRSARIFDINHNSSDGYRSTRVGGIVYRAGNSWNMVGGGLYSSRPFSAQLEIEAASVSLITKDPVTGKLIIGGNFDFALYDEIQDLVNMEANNPVYPRYLATWDGQTWGEEMTLSSVRPAGWSHRKIPRRLIFEGDLIYVFGELRGSITRDDQPAFDAYGQAVYSRSEGRFLLDENDNNIMGNGAWFRGGGVTASQYINDAVKSGDDFYIAGDFNAYQLGAGPNTAVDMDNITRWDGDTFHQLGLGVDGSQISVIRKFGDTYYLGGTFRRAYSGSRTWESAMVVGYDPTNREFSPFARGISGGGVQGLARVRDIAEDPATGDIYVAGRFINGIQEDGEEVSSRSLLRFSNGVWHAVATLSGGGPGPNQIPEATSLLRIGDQLYIGGRFSTIPNRHEHQLHIAQIDLPTRNFVPITFAEELRLNERLIVDLETDGRYLYMLLHPENANDIATGSVIRKNLTTSEVTSINGIVRGGGNTFSVTSMQADGEFLWVAGQLSNFRYFDGNGELQTVTGIPNVMILHPDTETWFYPPEDLFPTTLIYDIAKTGNTIYLANSSSNDVDRGKRIDLGSRESFNIGNGFSSSPLSLLLDDDRVWITGPFDLPRRLAWKEVVEADAAPLAMGAIQLSETTVRTGLQNTVNLYIANPGSADLTWNVSLTPEETGGFPVMEELFTLPVSSGITPGATMTSLPVSIDGTGIPTGRYRAILEVSSNDAIDSELSFTLDVTVNPLIAASGPYPSSGSIEAPIDTLLTWNRDEFAETIRVYLGTSPDLTEDDLIYSGEPVSQLDVTSDTGPLQFYTDYYWRVDQVNAISESVGEVWTFRTMLNPDEGIWVPVATSLNDWFLDVHFFDRDNGFIVGDNYLYVTSDGGSTLAIANQEGEMSDFYFLNQHFVDRNTGWVSGYSGRVFRTDDGADTWVRQETGVTQRLNSIFFLDASRGWAVGNNGTVISTSDGGATWEARQSGVTQNLRKVQFIDQQTGYAVGAGGVVITSNDGGATWVNRPVPGGENLFALHFRDELTGWTGGFGGVIYSTTDGGFNWTERDRDPTSLSQKNTINDINFLDDETGWAVGGRSGRSHLRLTTDGGITWQTRPAFADQQLNAIQIISSDEAWIAGNTRTLLRYTTDPNDAGAILPEPVALGTPANGAGDIGLLPGFSWNTAERAGLYHIQLSEDADFSNILINESTILENAFSVPAELNPLTTYYWRVRGLNDAGSGEWSSVWSFTTGAATSIERFTDIPTEVTLSQNYPNPFNPATNIRFGLPEQSDVSLEVYNLIGRRVAVIVNETRNAGWHTVTFDGSALSSGIYFYRLRTNETVITRKLTLVK